MKNQFDSLIKNALSQYGIYDYNAVFIRHNDNITIKVINNVDNSIYLLRIHVPITQGLQGVQHTFEGLTAEVELLNSLAGKSSLKLQQPIKNNHGSYVTTIIDSTINYCPLCTLLTWEEGDVFTGSEPNSSDIAYEIGVVLAKIHNFSSNWTIPQPFIRPNYDISKYSNLTNRLQNGITLNLFKEEHYEIITESMLYINRIFEGTPKNNKSWGIVHADLQGGNIIVNNNNIVIPIDFGFSGYGFFLFDLGITLTSFNTKLRERVLLGYKTIRNIDSNDEQLISAGFILAIFGAFGFNITNPKSYEWIQRRIPYVTENYCKYLLDKKSFILSIE